VLHGKSLPLFTGAVFVNSLQVLDSLQENPLTYGESVSATFNLRYPGQYFDKESNLHYNWMRSYDSKTDRYTQADPIGLQGGWNKFVYASANPLSYTDPKGLFDDALPLPITMPALTAACLANPATCGPVLAGAGGYAVGTLIYPIVEKPIADALDWCGNTSMSASGRWSCTASCNVTVIDQTLDGKVPARVTGSANGKTESDACSEAKRVATQSSPRGTYARHCQCSCSKS
jgi:RHS repeat-associated protein